jgi:hypothetical protein
MLTAHRARQVGPEPLDIVAWAPDERLSGLSGRLQAYLMPHGLLDHGVGNRRDLLGPRHECRPEAVGGDRSADDVRRLA